MHPQSKTFLVKILELDLNAIKKTPVRSVGLRNCDNNVSASALHVFIIDWFVGSIQTWQFLRYTICERRIRPSLWHRGLCMTMVVNGFSRSKLTVTPSSHLLAKVLQVELLYLAACKSIAVCTEKSSVYVRWTRRCFISPYKRRCACGLCSSRPTDLWSVYTKLYLVSRFEVVFRRLKSDQLCIIYDLLQF